MNRLLLVALLLIVARQPSYAQQPATVHCGQQEATADFIRRHPQQHQYHEKAESQLRLFELARRSGKVKRTTATVTLPVVVHLIHNNGAENITDAQVLAGIQHLNEAFANTGYYDPANGVNTQVQFCLAQRDPAGNPTNGITRNVSPLTVMNGPEHYSDDLAVKGLNRWNPSCYINIWLVRSIPGNVAGYAYLPSAHGMPQDGILMEAAYFGSSQANSVVTIHEMGHYLGLYHTFQGACKNDDCTLDGDRVCDTPPDQSTAHTACSTPVNSCSTDALSGFSTDVNDLKEDYMDYGNLSCMKVFTQGQADRMNWFIQNTRASLLQCKSCQTPCPAPVTANFTNGPTTVTTGTAITFTNASVNGSAYKWYLNNLQQATTTHFTHTFNTAGTYIVKMSAHSNNVLCDSAAKTVTITVTCPVVPQFTPPDTSVSTNSTITFTNATTGASTYQWFVDGILQTTTPHFTHTFTINGNYRIKLKASNGFCTDSLTRLVVVTNPCLTETFQRNYGGLLREQAYDIRPTQDGGSIVAGRSSSFNNGTDDGYLIKLDRNGQVQWSQVYGGAAEHAFYRVMPTRDGGYIAVGQTRSYGILTGAAWAVKTNATGAVQWSRQFGENSANGEIASNVLPTADGGYVITGRQDNAPTVGNVLVVKLDANGNTLWNKIYDDGDSDNGGAILEDNNGILIFGTSRSPTWHDAFLMKLDQANGNVIWAKKYDIDGRNNSGGAGIYKQGNQYWLQVITINNFSQTNTGRSMVLQVDLNGDAMDVKEIIAPDYVLGSAGAFAPTPDGGFITQHNENTADPDFNLIKISAAGTVEWARKYPRAGRQTTLALRLAANGGYISAGASEPGTNSQDVLVISTDALGQTPGCNAANLQVTVNKPPFTTIPFTWNDIRNGNFLPPANPTVQHVIAATQNTMLCAGTPCLPPPDPCTSTFQKTYAGTGSYHVFYLHHTPDGGSVIAGKANPVAGDPDPGSASYDALAMKLDAKGELEWANRIGGNQYDEFRKIKPTTDGGYIAIGCSRSFSNSQDIYLAKMAANGNLAWSKTFQSRSQILDYGLDVIEMADGGFAFTGTISAIFPEAKGLIAKTDVTGNIVWAWQFAQAEGVDFSSVLEDADTLVVGADYWSAGDQKYYGSIIKLNKFTGAVNASTTFSTDTRGNFALRLHKTPAGFLVGMHLLNGNFGSDKIPGVLHLDQNLQLQGQQKLSHQDPSHWTYPTFTSDGGYILSNSMNSFGGYTYGLLKANSAGSVSWTKNYGDFGGITTMTPANVQQYPDGTFISATTYTEQTAGSDGRIQVIKTAATGITPGCSTPDVFNTMQPASLHLRPTTWSNAAPFDYQLPATVTSSVSPVTLTVKAVCAGGNCQLAGLDGQDSICIRTDTLTYAVKRNSDCKLPVTWKIDQAYAQIVASTDTTIRLLFKQPGTVKLYATIVTACQTTSDSLAITIFDTVRPLNLGPDVQLCHISTWPLKAPAGYKTYQWHDHSADSVFTAYHPGTYHLLATDHCNNAYRDTVVITQAPPVPFDLGPDLKRCANDTLTLTAPGGFTNYRWTENYHIDTRYGPTIKIYTDKDTLYSVTAEKAPGCLVIDTIRVRVKQVAPLNLGPDTSLCIQQSLTLDAGTGFTGYAWNNGDQTQQVQISQKGTYIIAATNPNNCISYDTLEIINVYKLPEINLKEEILCKDQPLKLEAGNGFKSWLWQDGSTNSTFTVTQPGTYWVKVIDQHNCTNADTLSIAGIKDCRQYLYLPNAFSPNHDGLNDQFKPKAYGIPAHYKLTVYNRWGERIFETTDIAKGWDGTYRGQPQPAGTFVWTCYYKLAGPGQEDKKEKGVLLLVR